LKCAGHHKYRFAGHKKTSDTLGRQNWAEDTEALRKRNAKCVSRITPSREGGVVHMRCRREPRAKVNPLLRINEPDNSRDKSNIPSEMTKKVHVIKCNYMGD